MCCQASNCDKNLLKPKPNSMMRRFTHYFLMSLCWFAVVSCQDDEVSAPPKPSLAVNTTSGLVGDTEFTFTISEVDAQAIWLFPYGEKGSTGLPVKSFQDGVATVKVRYNKPGVFNAVVLSNNHADGGESIKNTISDPVTITIASDDRSISAFTFANSSSTEIDDAAGTIDVVVPYGTDVTSLKATFTNSAFSTVTVGGNAQTSAETANDFSGPVTYTVTANDGQTKTYVVNVTVTEAETRSTFKSITATSLSSANEDETLQVDIDSVEKVIVVLDTFGTPVDRLDSVQISHEMNSAFSIVKYDGSVLAQGKVFDLESSSPEFVTYPQDTALVSSEGPQTYQVYATAAPMLTVSFNTLNPVVSSEDAGFDHALNVLEGTDVEAIETTAMVTTATGVVVTGITVDGDLYVPGAAIDYSEPVTFVVTVNDVNLGISYDVKYTVAVTVLP